MAFPARYLGRSALFMARRTPIAVPSRSFSATSFNRMPEDPQLPPEPREVRPDEMPDMPEYSPEILSKEERSMYDMMSPEDRASFDAQNRRMVEQYNDIEKRKAAFAELDKSVAQIEKETPLSFQGSKVKSSGFWGDEEDDEFAAVEDADEDCDDNEITSMAHAEVELHREIREYARITAWDMPLLSKLAKPFTLPHESQILRFRYTTYMGEQHPAENKVVVELSSQDLTPTHLSESQRQTFLKLVGPRYNPDTDIVKMSCEKFTSRAQNKRYLGDLVESLIKEAKQGDAFADVPLDLRHHKPKPVHRFPESWVMTEERRKQLAARRNERQMLEKEKLQIVDGNDVVAQAALALPSLNPALNARATEERERVSVKIGAKTQKKKLR